MTTILRRKNLGFKTCKSICERSTTGIKVVRNDQELPTDSLYIRWGCTSTVPAEKVINSAKAIHRVADKKGFRILLSEHGLCPTTWTDWQASQSSMFPAIVRPAQHSQGKDVILVTSKEECASACAKFNDYYISEYIPKVAEFRVFVMQGRIVWIAEKIPENPEAIAWNHAQGSVYKNVRWGKWNPSVCRVALESWRLSRLHFGGVDVILDAHNRAYTVEINSGPTMFSPYREWCTAKAFDHLVTSGNYAVEAFDFPTIFTNWKGLLHPGML